MRTRQNTASLRGSRVPGAKDLDRERREERDSDMGVDAIVSDLEEMVVAIATDREAVVVDLIGDKVNTGHVGQSV